MSEPVDFRAAVVAAAEAKGLSKAELARRSGLTYSQVHHYLGGVRDLTGEPLGRLCGALGISLKVPRVRS